MVLKKYNKKNSSCDQFRIIVPGCSSKREAREGGARVRVYGRTCERN
jgi:hypothetical protein